MIHGIFGCAKGTAEHPYFGTSSGFSGREGVEKREIYAVALGGHHFYDLFLQGQGGHDSFAPWIRYWGRGKTDFLLLPPWAGNMFHYIEFCFGDFLWEIIFYFLFFQEMINLLALVMVQTTLHFHQLTFLTELSGIRNEFVRQFSSAVKWI